MRTQKGSALILVLLFISLFLVMGIGFLASKASDYRSVRRGVLSAQAKSLAMAGLEESRAKLIKDFNFPPLAALDQPVYQINEDVHDIDGSTVVGAYEVRVETDKQAPPYELLRIRSTGLLGGSTAPTARRTLEALVDLREPAGNPAYFQIVSVKDLGGI